MLGTITAVVIAAAVVGGYFERQRLKAIAARAEANLVNRALEAQYELRAKISGDYKTVVADIKSWEERQIVSTKEVIAQFEGRLKQIL